MCRLLIEEVVGRELINIGCRHHIMEVVLSNVFMAVLGGTGGPEVGLFKRFQKNWSYIHQAQYSPTEDDLLNSDMEILRNEMVAFYTNAVEYQQPREDYLELL